MSEQIIRAVVNGLEESIDRKEGEPKNLTDAMLEIASALRALGNGNAASEMGALEFLASQVKEGADTMTSALCAVTDSIDRLPG